MSDEMSANGIPAEIPVRPQPHGGALRSGGTYKNAGRKPDAWKRYWQMAVSDKEVRAAANGILKDKAHPAFATVLKWAAEQGFGKPGQTVTVEGNEEKPLVVRVVNE